MSGGKKDIDPASELREDDDAPTLPELDLSEPEAEAGTLAHGRAAIARAVKHAPAGPGVYRMIDAKGEVLYVGKAKSIRKRVASYTRPVAYDARIARMISATVSMEFVSTATETEALLLEANLIKRLRPRFNVLLRDDKSFPYILITSDHWAPQILKHRGARTRQGHYYGPFANAGAVNRTINALQRAFLLRSCSDSFFESRSRPCLLYQIKRCSGPCTQEIDFKGYAELVREANAFLDGKSRTVQQELSAEMEQASQALDFERAAIYRDRLAALSAITSTQGINPRTIEEADVFAVHQEGGYSCVEVFFFRTGQNWGNRAYFPKADRAFGPAEVLSAFLAQFYDDKPPPRLIIVSHDFDERALLAEALSAKSARKVEVAVPQRGERKDLVMHALANAREALGRKLADTASQQRLFAALKEAFGLTKPPQRIEVYDNSHIAGTNAVGAMIVAGPEGFRKNSYRKFNIKRPETQPGDDFAMMREVLERRFARLEKEDPDRQGGEWPDLLLIDGGKGQLSAVCEVLEDMGVHDVPVVGVAKGPHHGREGREVFHLPGGREITFPTNSALLFYLQRLRDEAHRFAIGTHRAKRAKSLTTSTLDEVPGIGPTRKRALLMHFGTARAVKGAALEDLEKAPGISRATARQVYDFFHPAG
jgi:excinuclease ABC subunit C